MISILAANHDPHEFPNPGKIDFNREARQHIAFSFGVHQCLGQNLARMELQVAIPMLFERFPDIRLAVPEEDLRYKDDGLAYGLLELPVKW